MTRYTIKKYDLLKLGTDPMAVGIIDRHRRGSRGKSLNLLFIVRFLFIANNCIRLLYGQHFQHSMEQPGMVTSLARGQLNKENEFLCLRSRPRIWSHETGSAVPSRVSLLVSTYSG